MFRKLKIAGMMISGMLVLVPSLSAAPRVIFRPSFGFGFYRPFYRPFGGYPFDGSTRVIVPAPVTGELKLDTNRKDAQVYIDGGYLGIAKKFKAFDLKPGGHNIELRDDAGNVLFQQRVEIIPGRTTEVNAKGIAG